jgi:hypothetical protein
VKSFVNAAAGSGAATEEEWLRASGVSKVPEWLARYKAELVELAKKDVSSNPGIVQKLKECGVTNERDLLWKTFYALNSASERKIIDAACSAVAGVARVVAFEYDGLVLAPVGSRAADAQWEETVLRALNQVAAFTLKPYRSFENLLQMWHSTRSSFDRATLFLEDEQWKSSEAVVREAMSRLRAGETVPGCVGRALTRIPRPDGTRFFDDMVTVAGAKGSLEPWVFRGFWKQLDAVEANIVLSERLEAAMCALLRTEQRHVPERFLKPGFQSGVLDKICSVLFEATFLGKVDCETSAHFVQFACGRVFDTRTCAVSPGRPDMYISRACGYPFPHEALASMDTKFGVIAAEVFDRIAQFDAEHPEGVPEYPADIVDALENLAKQPEFTLLRNVHECFAHPDHGWVVTVWRCLKLIAACFWAAPIERFVNDEGSGANGKSFVVAIMEALLGSYTHQIKEAIVTRSPPGPEAPQPALLDLRGRRVLLAPEIEGSLPIQSAWVKRLCDPGVTWLGRELYGRREVAFRLRTVFVVCTNRKLQFSTLDGGIARRAISVRYPFQFVGGVPGPDEKKLDDTLKSSAYLREHLPGLLWLVLLAGKKFFNEAQRGIQPIPKVVKASTDALLAAEWVEAVETYAAEFMSPTAEQKRMASKSELLASLRADPKIRELRIARRDLEEAVAQVFAFRAWCGRRDRVFRKADSAYLCFNSA